MRDVTLCFLLKDDHVCLAMKKRGFGVGKWNGVGGKVEHNETIEEGVLREMYEEIGVRAKLEHLEKVGTLAFHFDQKEDWNQLGHVFFVREWYGEPVESEEMAPAWYHKDKLPYEQMWIDDPLWLPHVLEGKNIDASFTFSSDGARILKSDVKVS